MTDTPDTVVRPDASPRPKRSLLARIYGAVAVVTTLATLAASVVAFVGIWVWIDEKSDRDEERAARREERTAREAEAELRRVMLIAEALTIIDRESSDGSLFTSDSPLLSWAFETLTSENQPIVISAHVVLLEDLDLECARLDIRAPFAVIDGSRFQSSEIIWTGRDLSLRGVGAYDTKITANISRRLNGWVEVVTSKLQDVTAHVEYGMSDENGLARDGRVTVLVDESLIRSSAVSVEDGTGPFAERIELGGMDFEDRFARPETECLSPVFKDEVGSDVPCLNQERVRKFIRMDEFTKAGATLPAAREYVDWKFAKPECKLAQGLQRRRDPVYGWMRLWSDPPRPDAYKESTE